MSWPPVSSAVPLSGPSRMVKLCMSPASGSATEGITRVWIPAWAVTEAVAEVGASLTGLTVTVAAAVAVRPPPSVTANVNPSVPLKSAFGV